MKRRLFNPDSAVESCRSECISTNAGGSQLPK